MSIAALETQLRANLDEWEHWLVYGDWLSDQGDERGTLVRLEHRMETEALSAQEKRALQRQVDELVLRHGDDWKIPAPEGAELTWKNGFVIGAQLPDSSARVELLTHPQARLLVNLKFKRGSLDIDHICELADSPGLAHVRSLDLSHQELGSDVLEALARSPYAGELGELRLQHNRLRGAEALREVVSLHGLVLLDLRSNPLSVQGARALAEAPCLAGLRSLYLDRKDIRAEGARALGSSKTLPLPIRRYWRAR